LATANATIMTASSTRTSAATILRSNLLPPAGFKAALRFVRAVTRPNLRRLRDSLHKS
jgi:hypothetical protein